MMTVNVHEAKTCLSRLLDRVAAGEEVTIARYNVPVARLVPIEQPIRKRRPDTYAGRIHIAEDFDEPLDEDFMASFEEGDVL